MSLPLSSSIRLPAIHRLIRKNPSMSPRPSTVLLRPNVAAGKPENSYGVLIAKSSSSLPSSSSSLPSSSSSSLTALKHEEEAPPITVRIVSINDVYDLKNLPKLATLLRSLGHKPLKDHHHYNNSTIFPINGYQQYKISQKRNDIQHHQQQQQQQQQERQQNQNQYQHRTHDLPIAPSAVTLNGDFLCPSALSSIDNGRGHVAAIRAAGITHVSLGNHEADVPLEVLKERLGELSQRGLVKVLNSNVSGLGRHSCQVDVISSNCGKIKVGLVGLLSDEADMFRDGTFRGLRISSVRERYENIYNKMKLMESVHCLVPLTHQTLAADEYFAKAILEMEDAPMHNVILGGHEHVKILRIISNESDPEKQISIVKTGQDAERAAIIDLQFHPTTHQVIDVAIHFEELDQRYLPCPIVQSIVDKHMSALNRMEKFIVLDTKTMLSAYFVDPVTHRILPLSSEYTRYEQTTVGAFFCSAIKAELNTDVCIINGAPIKGNRLYSDGTMTYDQIKHELPFPLKIIVVKMTRKQLREAIQYSRKHIEEGKPAMVMEDGRIERRGYLQTDFEYWRESNSSYDTNHDNDVLSVALPRNLLKGFCKIKPLMDLNAELEARNALPNDDDFMKAIDLIVRYCCKDRWISIAKQFTFSDLDLKRDGTLCREDIRIAMKTVMKEEPSDGLVDEMVKSIDLNSSGFVEEKEFNEILARVRRHS